MNVFTIVEGSLKITYNDDVTLLIAKKDLSIISNELYKTVPRAVLFNLNGGYNEKVFDMPLSICSEDGIAPFTLESFIVFAETYLGFYGSGGGGGGVPEAPIDGLQYGRQDASWTPIAGTEPVTITKTEIDILISTNSLVAGTLYEITGVHPTLYDDGTTSGTTIYLQAMTNNKLATQGNGVFYNPLYDKEVDGFGIWNNKSSWEAILSAVPISAILGTTDVSPNSIATDSDGNIYTANENSNNVSKITPDGTSTILGTTGNTPFGITIDTVGNVYTSNRLSNNVTKITPDGTSTILGTTGTNPSGITIDDDGNIYTSNQGSNNVSKITLDGTSTILGTTELRPIGIIVDADGNIYTANFDSNNVTKITPDGTSTILGTTGNTPFGITMDNDGNIYTTNSNSNNVSKITPDGTSSILGTTGSNPYGIVTDGENIYTCNISSNNISKITLDGTSIIYSTTGSAPSSIIFGNEGLYISNKGSNDVSKIIEELLQFNANELITANNGATGQLFQTLDWNQFIVISGDWSTATSITGDVTGATASVADIELQSYTIDGKAIWGGYSWTNTTGNVGQSIDVLNLDTTDWSKDVYDDEGLNYNQVLDLIEYDIENDWISRRYEVKANNNVVCTKEGFNQMGFAYSAISVFMFGNMFDNDLDLGIGNNIVNHAYNENVNFTGSYLHNLIFELGSYQINLTFGADSCQYNLTFRQESNQQNIIFGANSFQNNLTFGQNSGQVDLVFGIGSSQSSITFGIGSAQSNLKFGIDSFQNIILFGNASNQSSLIFGIGSSQSNLIFGVTSSQNSITFSVNSGQSNLIFGSSSNQDNITIPDNLVMTNITFEILTYIDGVDFSSATLVYQDFPKTIYKRPDGLNRLRYYNNSDILVIAEVTD